MVSRRHRGPIHLAIEFTGLKIVGDGERLALERRTSNRRRAWREWHLGADSEGFVVAFELTEGGVDTTPWPASASLGAGTAAPTPAPTIATSVAGTPPLDAHRAGVSARLSPGDRRASGVRPDAPVAAPRIPRRPRMAYTSRMPHPRGPNRLVSIKFSHYNEKARWALDRCGVPYIEEPHLPITHFAAVIRALPRGGAGDSGSTRYSTPVLITAAGAVPDSTAIARFADEQTGHRSGLFAAAHHGRIASYDDHFGRHLGPATRCVAYHYILQDAALSRRLARANVPGLESALWTAGYPAFAALIRRALHIRQASADRSMARVRAIFEEVGVALADGRPYLCGDAFTLADLSFAALGAPALLVTLSEGYQAYVPAIDEAPTALARLARELRATPAGRYVLRLFAEERTPPTT